MKRVQIRYFIKENNKPAFEVGQWNWYEFKAQEHHKSIKKTKTRWTLVY